MTAAQPFHGQPQAAERTLGLDGFDSVGGARWSESAVVAEPRADKVPVEPNRRYQ